MVSATASAAAAPRDMARSNVPGSASVGASEATCDVVAEDTKLNVRTTTLYAPIATPTPARSGGVHIRPIIAVSTRPASGSMARPTSAGPAMSSISLSMVDTVSSSAAFMDECSLWRVEWVAVVCNDDM